MSWLHDGMTKAGTDWIGNHSTRNIRINLFEAAIFVAPSACVYD
jgi:hypothetical protein